METNTNNLKLVPTTTPATGSYMKMPEPNWGVITMFPGMMGMSYQMAAMKLLMDAHMKKYMPIQYRMMETMQAAMEKGDE